MMLLNEMRDRIPVYCVGMIENEGLRQVFGGFFLVRNQTEKWHRIINLVQQWLQVALHSLNVSICDFPERSWQLRNEAI